MNLWNESLYPNVGNTREGNLHLPSNVFDGASFQLAMKTIQCDTGDIEETPSNINRKQSDQDVVAITPLTSITHFLITATKIPNTQN